jgi:signal transduction histidine kinase
VPPRPLLAAASLLAAGGLPLLAVAQGWSWFLDGPLLVILALAAGYAAGVWLPRWATVLGGSLLVAALVRANQLLDAEYHWLDDAVFFLVLVGAPAAAGAAVALRGRQVRRLEVLRGQLDEQHQAEVAAARLEEQSRVHQQLHSRLAERIAAIALRAEGAQRAPDPAALTDLEEESRAVLDQLRTALGSLRADEPEPSARPTPPRARPAGPTPLDLAIAGMLGAAMAVETFVSSLARGPAWANALAAAVVAAPLVARRSRPVASVAATLLAATLTSLWLTPLAGTVTGVALLTVVFFSVGAWCPGVRVLAVGLMVAMLGTVLVGLASGVGGAAAWAVMAWGLVAAVLGRVTAGWHERLRRTQEVVIALEEGRGAALRLARARERQALASELHDTVAHAMTVVCLQAGAGRRAGEEPVEVLTTIAAAATSSLAELRDGLDSLESEGPPLEPARIVALGQRVGVAVDVTTPTVVDGVAGTLGLRVLREAIVNTARHAPGASARVSVTRDEGILGLEVLDDGGRRAPVITGSGRGLEGLAETLSDVGGTLEWGPRPTGGFQVRASIPEVPA